MKASNTVVGRCKGKDMAELEFDVEWARVPHCLEKMCQQYYPRRTEKSMAFKKIQDDSTWYSGEKN